MVDVRKLVSRAPATFPKFPQDYQKPIIVPRPLLPNQFAKIAFKHGQPTDCMRPLTENRKAKKKTFVQFLMPHIDMTSVTVATQKKLMINMTLGFLWSPSYPLTNKPIE